MRGSSQGAAVVPGVELVLAANHTEIAIRSHAANFPGADHYPGDVRSIDMAKFPRADLFWASPSCPPFSSARGKRRDFDRDTQAMLFETDEDARAEAGATRGRALMHEIPQYLEAMKLRGKPVLAGVVENVIEARLWDMWPSWLARIRGLGYQVRVIAINSMHAAPRRGQAVPQSRDRLFAAYLDNFSYWMPDSGRFRVTGLLGSRRILGRVAGVLARNGWQAVSGGLQLGCGVVGEWLAVAEAGDLDVEGGQPLERCGCLGAADVEYAAHDLSGWAARRSVAGEQYLVPGKVERDAARRMAGHGYHYGTVAEAERVAVVQLPVNPGRHHGFGRELAHDLLVDGLFPVGQARRRPGAGPAARARMNGASSRCASTSTSPQPAISAAAPM